MTTTPIPSITDEQLAEIECSLKPIGFNSYNDNLRGLITRLRAAEKDAERYRFLRNNGDIKFWDSLRWIYPFAHDSFDAAIDRAIQEQSK